jgi:predicted transcriptional regulator
MQEKAISMSIAIPPSLFRAVDECARADRRTRSNWVCTILEDAVAAQAHTKPARSATKKTQPKP